MDENAGAMLIVLLIALLVYFLPYIIASHRGIKGTGWIFLLNLFFAGTGIVWLVLFIWACTAEKKKKDD